MVSLITRNNYLDENLDNESIVISSLFLPNDRLVAKSNEFPRVEFIIRVENSSSKLFLVSSHDSNSSCLIIEKSLTLPSPSDKIELRVDLLFGSKSSNAPEKSELDSLLVSMHFSQRN